jgi:hypothetical protein
MCEYGYMSAAGDGFFAASRNLSRFRYVVLELEMQGFSGLRQLHVIFA